MMDEYDAPGGNNSYRAGLIRTYLKSLKHKTEFSIDSAAIRNTSRKINEFRA